MSRVFLDANVPMYAGGTEHPLREPSQRVIMAVAKDELDAVTDAEVFQELRCRDFIASTLCSLGARAGGNPIDCPHAGTK